MMLLVDVNERFSAVQVLEHPWVNVSDFFLSLYLLLTFLCKIADFLITLSPFKIVPFVFVAPIKTWQNSYASPGLFHQSHEVSMLMCILTVRCTKHFI